MFVSFSGPHVIVCHVLALHKTMFTKAFIEHVHEMTWSKKLILGEHCVDAY